MHKNAFLFRCSESDRAEFGMNDGGMRSPMQGTLAEVILLFSQGVANSSRPEDRQLGSRYLAHLAPLLAAAVLGRDLTRNVDALERLLGNTWLIDEAPFAPALARWHELRQQYAASSRAGRQPEGSSEER